MPTSRSELNAPFPENKIEFGQERLADFIVDEIQDDPDIHIAVNGPWGSGKTTVLEEVKTRLKKSDDEFLTTWYEPWRYSPDQTTLRRTFLKNVYDDVSEQLSGIPSLDDAIFHFERKSREDRDTSEYLSEVYGSLVARRNFFLLLLGIVIGLVGIRILATFIQENIVRTLAVSAIDVLLFATLIGAIAYFRNDLISEFAESTTFQVKEPKISEIDLFEDKYTELLNKLEDEEKTLVVFIDDIDRCSVEQIREVITGLSTYLDPDDEGAPVSIVAAIDGPKVVNAFSDTDSTNSSQRPNIINKTFQIVLPVPSLSRENVAELIDVTASDLDYQISTEEKQHITRLAISHANANLRIIRTALSDVVWMKKIGLELMNRQVSEISESQTRLFEDDSILFRISLIKLLSENEDLRRFVTDASMWLERSKRSGDIRWELFDISPRFEPGGLDPRPLLALNMPNEYSAEVYDFDEIDKNVQNGNPGIVMDLCSKYDAAQKVNIAYDLMNTDVGDLDTQQKARYVNSIIDILAESIPAINNHRLDLFSDCITLIDEDRNIMDNVGRNDYSKWLKIAIKIGPEALDELINPNSPLYEADRNQFLSEMSNLASDYTPDVIDRVLELELSEVERSNQPQSANRVQSIFQSENIGKSDKAPEYLLSLLRNWSFEDQPDGPPEALFVGEVVEKLRSGDERKEAIDLFKKVGAQGSAGTDYLDILLKHDWPTEERNQDE